MSVTPPRGTSKTRRCPLPTWSREPTSARWSSTRKSPLPRTERGGRETGPLRSGVGGGGNRSLSGEGGIRGLRRPVEIPLALENTPYGVQLLPLGQRLVLNDRSRVRSGDHLSVADVHDDVPRLREDEIPWLKSLLRVDRPPHVDLLVSRAREVDPHLLVRPLDQVGAVEARGRWPRAEDVGLPDLGRCRLHRKVRVRACRVLQGASGGDDALRLRDLGREHLERRLLEARLHDPRELREIHAPAALRELLHDPAPHESRIEGGRGAIEA